MDYNSEVDKFLCNVSNNLCYSLITLMEISPLFCKQYTSFALCFYKLFPQTMKRKVKLISLRSGCGKQWESEGYSHLLEVLRTCYCNPFSMDEPVNVQPCDCPFIWLLATCWRSEVYDTCMLVKLRFELEVMYIYLATRYVCTGAALILIVLDTSYTGQ